MFAYEAEISTLHLSGVKSIKMEIIRFYSRLLRLDDGYRR